MTTAMQLLNHGAAYAGSVVILISMSILFTWAISSVGRALIQERQGKQLPTLLAQKRPYKEPAWKTHDVAIEVVQDVMQYAVAGEGTKFYLVRCYSCEAMLLTAQWPAQSGHHYEPNSSAAIRAGWTNHDIPGVGSKYLCPDHTRAVRELLDPNA